MTDNNVRPLVVLDCDATTIREEVIELLADVAGTREEVTRITEQAMRGELDFAESLKARVATLAGIPETVLADAAAQVTFNPGLFELIDAVHARDGKIGVVSGGFQAVLDRFLPDTGIDYWLANELEITDGKLTGKVLGDIVTAETKASQLQAWAATENIPMAHTVAVGDGANDLKMMEVAAISVGFMPKPIVRKQAKFVAEESLAEIIPLLKMFE